MNTIDLLKKFVFSLNLLICCFAVGCTAPKTGNTNLDIKDSEEPGTGGFVWGKNDKKTGLPEEEKTNEDILRRQKEVLKRQEIEQLRLEKEKQDILRQRDYNQKFQELQK